MLGQKPYPLKISCCISQGMSRRGGYQERLALNSNARGYGLKLDTLLNVRGT